MLFWKPLEGELSCLQMSSCCSCMSCFPMHSYLCCIIRAVDKNSLPLPPKQQQQLLFGIWGSTSHFQAYRAPVDSNSRQGLFCCSPQIVELPTWSGSFGSFCTGVSVPGKYVFCVSPVRWLSPVELAYVSLLFFVLIIILINRLFLTL